MRRQNVMAVTDVFAFLVIAAVTCAAPGFGLELRVTPSQVVPGSSENMTITCRTNPYQLNHRAPSSLTIMRNRMNWEVIAKITDLTPVVKVSDAAISGWDGQLSYGSSVAHLSVTWSKQSSDKYGQYMCLVTSFNDAESRIDTHTTTLTIGGNFKPLDILLLMQQDRADMAGRLEGLINRTEFARDALQTATRADMAKIRKELSQLDTELNETLKEQNDEIQKSREHYEISLNTSQQRQDEQIAKLNSQLQEALERGFLMIWPRGSYGLPMAATGCPTSAGISWKEGWRRQHTESTDRNKDQVSPGNHLVQPVLSREEGQNFVYQRFCVKTDSASPGPVWPKGSYCINKHGLCPSGFQETNRKWNEENTNFNGTSDGQLPDAVFDGPSTMFYFCCRSDGVVEQAVDLPRSQPFYLYRFGPVCQQVSGMNVTEEFIIFDTENLSSAGQFPPTEDNNLTLNLCYYREE